MTRDRMDQAQSLLSEIVTGRRQRRLVLGMIRKKYWYSKKVVTIPAA